jgi:hypothetical protein
MAQSLTFVLFFLLVTVASVAVRGASAGLVPAIPIGKRYIVGGADGWRVPPPENKDMYIKWADSIQFFVEDSIGKGANTRSHRHTCIVRSIYMRC